MLLSVRIETISQSRIALSTKLRLGRKAAQFGLRKALLKAVPLETDESYCGAAQRSFSRATLSTVCSLANAFQSAFPQR